MVLRAHAVHPGHHRDIQPAIIAYLVMKSIEQCKRCCENGDDALLREEVIVIPSVEFYGLQNIKSSFIKNYCLISNNYKLTIMTPYKSFDFANTFSRGILKPKTATPVLVLSVLK